MGRSQTRSSPAVGGVKQVTILMVVVLPAPFGPRRPRHSPGLTRKSSASTTRRVPYSLLRPRASTMASLATRGILEGRRRLQQPRVQQKPFRMAGGTAGSEPERLLAMAPLAAVLRLAAPTTLVMAVSAVSNVVYTYFVSRLGADAIAAVSLVFPVSLLAITAMAGGIGAGASSAVARALGAGHPRRAAVIAEHGVLLALVLGVLFALGIFVGAASLFTLMGGRGVVLASATLFARVLFGGAAITFVGAMFDSIMRGEGNVRIPALWSSTSLLFQIVLTPLFMFVAGWGLVGAALAALTSQLLATIPRA